MNTIEYVVGHSTELVSSGGILVGFFLVFLECFIPALPLSVFVALNVNAFGFLLGVFISWVATSLGSYCCYLFFGYVETKFIQNYMKKKMVQKVQRGIDRFQNIQFTELVLLITLPFTPSSLINILSGLTRMPKEKFLCALLIGKIFSIVFWGYIGKSLLESLTDLNSLIYIFIALVLAFIFSKIVSRKMNIE